MTKIAWIFLHSKWLIRLHTYLNSHMRISWHYFSWFRFLVTTQLKSLLYDKRFLNETWTFHIMFWDWILMNTFCFRGLSLARKRSCCLVTAGRVEAQVSHSACTDTQGGGPLITAEEGRVFQLLIWCPLTLRRGGLAITGWRKSWLPSRPLLTPKCKLPTWPSQPSGGRVPRYSLASMEV